MSRSRSVIFICAECGIAMNLTFFPMHVLGLQRALPESRYSSMTGASISSKPSKSAWQAIASKPATVKPQ